MSASDCPASDLTPASGQTGRGRVVLLHGLGCNRMFTALLAWRLAARGYGVEHWGYGSVRQSLPRLVDRFSSRFETLQRGLPEGMPLHIVGHSLGSIIVRAALARAEYPRLRRFVMLSPPNCGSHVASLVGQRLKWLTDLVDELADREDSLVNGLPQQLGAEVGVIAAEWDYVVRVASTHIPGEADHIVMPSRHTGLLFRRPVAEQIMHFLEHGRFHRPACPFCATALDSRKASP